MSPPATAHGTATGTAPATDWQQDAMDAAALRCAGMLRLVLGIETSPLEALAMLDVMVGLVMAIASNLADTIAQEIPKSPKGDEVHGLLDGIAAARRVADMATATRTDLAQLDNMMCSSKELRYILQEAMRLGTGPERD